MDPVDAHLEQNPVYMADEVVHVPKKSVEPAIEESPVG